MSPRRVSIVPHTHWDREWYAPYQTFRLRLVDLLDEFLPLVERDLSYARFLLDGQMAVVDDYLEVRPEAEPLLRRLAASGRLSMGPWYILMDEFLVSGETMVRNLQMGLERAAAFGGGMQVGYLPDMFGHVAQMPQLLRLAGIDHAVVWRGVPSAVDRSAFWWEAPDGSTVRAEYLMTGYGNGAAIPDDAKALVRRIAAHEEELSSFLLDGLLFMNGTDHQVPQPWLGRVVDEVNEIQDDYVLEVTSLPEYLATAPTEGLPQWTGELRSGARANLLMGVASNRVDVKQAAARTERALERSAEPLCALFMAPDAYPSALLDLAWREVVRNAAHDSICACSVDEVVNAVLHRFAEARQIADGLTVRALGALGSSLAAEGTYVVNSSARARGGLVEVVLPGEGPVEGAQVLTQRPALLSDLTLSGAELAGVLGQIRSQQLDDTTYVNAVEVEEGDDLIELTLHADSRLRENLLVEEIKRDLYARVGQRPDVQVRVRVQQPPSVRILTRVEPVAGYGWAPFTAEAPRVAPVVVRTNDAGEVSVANELLTLVVGPTTGLFSIDGHGGLGRLVDDGDHGDTYNYSPPATDTVVDRPDHVTVEALEDGPMRARVAIQATYTWPEKIEGRTEGARDGARTVQVETILEVQAGEAFVRVHTRFENPCRDHRLRAWFPLPTRATTSEAECAFTIVERGLEAEGGTTEHGLPTFPSRRFVRAGELTIAHEGLLEYELVDGGGILALTLLRATGMLSRVEMAYRPLPAGPPIEMEGPQMVGPVEARYALAVGDIDPFAMVDDAFLPLHVLAAGGGGQLPAQGQALSVEGAQVSALQRRNGALELRVFNPTAETTTVTVGDRRGWIVDLLGRPVAAFDGSFPLGPWQIATASITEG